MGAAIETLERRNLLTYAIDLFQDINTLGVSSEIGEVVQLGSESFFVADDGVNGSELWKTDGTAGGTVLVKDVLPGPDTSQPSELTVVGSELFFTAIDEQSEVDLWKTDGTEAGTVKVFDADASGVFYLTDLTASGTKLFFTAYQPAMGLQPATGYELWVSDGTSAGTQLVKDINPDQTIIDRPQELTDVNGTLFFTSYDDGYYNRELWKSDGTAAGTVMVADLGIDPGIDGVLGTADDDPSVSSNPSYLTNLNGVLYFAAEDYDDGVELYKSDGTQSGTVRVADLNPTGSSYPEELTPFGAELFFSATDGSGGRHLYKSDGTMIDLVADTTAGLGSSTPVDLEVVGSELFFSANGVVPATTVTAVSPTMTAQNSRIVSGNYAGIVAETTSASGGLLAGFNSSITFTSTAQGGSNNNFGWVSSSARIGDPGVGLTSIEVGDLYVEDIDPGELAVNAWDWEIEDAAGLTNISFSGFASGNELVTSTPGSEEGLLFELFLNGSTTPAATDTVSGPEFDNWFLGRDAANVDLSHPGGPTTTSATVRVSFANSTFPGMPNGSTEAFLVGATLTADLSPATTKMVDAGRELHKTDGTAVGTVLVKDIVPVGSSNPFQLTEVGGKLFFAADDVFGDGLELWMSDGTESGTVQVIDSLPGNDLYGAPLDGAPQLFGGLGGELLFTTTNSARDRELWITDGSPAGTNELANINPATGDANVSDLIRFGSNLYFVANDGLNGEAIWKADTTTGKAVMLADVSPLSTDKLSKPEILNPQTEEIVFYNNSLGTAGGVYITNASGNIQQVSDRRPVELDEDGTMFVVVDPGGGRTIYFVTDDGVTGNELWSINSLGIASQVVDLIPGSTGSNPADLTVFNRQLYFTADTNSTTVGIGDVGRELFRTSGSGATLVADIRSGSADSNPEQLTVSGSNLYFTANDGSNGTELWRTFGGGTTIVSDLRSGSSGSDPANLTDVNGLLYFTANDGSSGFEPYRSSGFSTSTYRIADINPGSASSNPDGFMSALGEVYFSADDGSNGVELWKTNGTAGNAALVSDIQPGGSSQPVPLHDTPRRLIFSAAGTIFNDRELWATDGATNTLIVEDLYPPEYFGSNPDEIVEISGRLYFVAETGPYGRELFVLEEVAPAVTEVVVGGGPGAPVAEVQRSTLDMVTVVFDGNVDVPAAAVQVINRDTNTALTSVIVNTRYEYEQTYVEVTFGSGPSVIDRGPGGQLNSLADGNYQLNILSSLVSSPVSGAAMAADYQFGADQADDFFRFYGDIDGDRDVDLQDYGLFGATFLKSSGVAEYNEDFDFDGDGDVDGLDHGRMRQRLLRRLTAK